MTQDHIILMKLLEVVCNPLASKAPATRQEKGNPQLTTYSSSHPLDHTQYAKFPIKRVKEQNKIPCKSLTK